MQKPHPIFLHTIPDFTVFWFNLGISGELLMTIAFSQNRELSFDLIFGRSIIIEGGTPGSLNKKEVNAFLRLVLQAIELFALKYPRRRIRCTGDDPIPSSLFKLMLANQYLLTKMFSIDVKPADYIYTPSPSWESPTFLLTTKLDFNPKPNPVIDTSTVYSQLFDTQINLCVLNVVSD